MPVRRHRCVGQDGGDGVIPTDAGDLFGDVGLDHEVAPPGRDRGEEGLGLPSVDLERLGRRRHHDLRAGRCRHCRDADPLEDIRLFRGGGRRADQAVDAQRPEGNERRRRFGRIRVDSTDRYLAAGPLADEPSRPVGTELGEPVLLALLEPKARL